MLRQIAGWLVLIVAVSGISLGLAYYKYRELEAARIAAAATPEPSSAVAMGRARKGEWTPRTRAIGTVVAKRQLEIRNEIAGTIAEIGFTSGSVVEAGQVLVQFDVRQEQQALAATQADARLAKLTLERREALRNSSAFSQQEFDKAREESAAATARAKNLEVAIDKKRIVAPFRARIGITNLQPGAYLDVGTRIATLQGVDTDTYVDFSLPQDSAAILRAGSTVTLQSIAIPNGGSAEAKIVAEDDSADRANRTVRFRAVAAGLGEVVRPGIFVDVIAGTGGAQSVVLVPLGAVRRSPYGEHVFVVAPEDGKLRARQRVVETGQVVGQDIAIGKGLEVGELIATSGSFKLNDGALVQEELPPAATDKPAQVSTN
jgi:membrane fusion protein (multidrug efflux system)